MDRTASHQAVNFVAWRTPGMAAMRYTWTLLLVLPLGMLVGSGRGERNPFSRPEPPGNGRASLSQFEQAPLLPVQVPETDVEPEVKFDSPNITLVGQTLANPANQGASPPSVASSSTASTAPSRNETPSSIRIVTPVRESESRPVEFSTRTSELEEELNQIADEPTLTVPSQNQITSPGSGATVGSYFVTQQQIAPPAPTQEEATPADINETAGAVPAVPQTESSFSDLPPVTPRRSPLFGPSIYGENRIARFGDNKILLPTLISPTTNPSDIGSKKLPEDFSGDQLVLRELLREGPDRGEDWALTAYFWHAPNTYSHPLYFEDVMLERHGHQRFPALQPFISGGRFFATIPMLPYLMTINPACDYDYHLGHFRPGSCAPGLVQRPPYVRRAAVVQAAATAGAFIAIP